MKILVAIDGSDHALQALRYALTLVRRSTDPPYLILAHAHHDAPLRGAGSFVGQAALDQYLDDQARAALAPAEALCAATNLPHETRLLRGPIGPTLALTAVTEGCELIVLGTKGRHALQNWLLGSTAQRVASLATIPVLLVP